MPAPGPQIRHQSPGRGRRQRHDPPLGRRPGALLRHHPHEWLRDHVDRQVGGLQLHQLGSAHPFGQHPDDRVIPCVLEPARPFPVTSSRSVMNDPASVDGRFFAGLYRCRSSVYGCG